MKYSLGKLSRNKKKYRLIIPTLVSLIVLSFVACQYNLESRFLLDPGSDLISPVITATTPSRDAHVATLPTATLTFSEEVIGADNLVNYSLSGSGAGSLSISTVTDLGSNVYEVAFSGPTIDGTINLNVSGVTDLMGNLMVPDAVTVLGWWNTSWTERVKLTVDNSAQSEALLDFTALVKLNSSRITYASAQPAGQDIRFIDSSRSGLNHEKEVWNASGDSSIWVMLPTISAGSDTGFIWMYYGNAGASDNQNPGATWDSDFGLVWHFDNATGVIGDVTDSIGNHDVDSYNVSVAPSGLGNGYEMNGTSSYVDPGAGNTYFNSLINARTVEIHFKANNFSGNPTLYDEGGTGNGLYLGHDGTNLIASARNSNTEWSIPLLFSDTAGYHNLVQVFDGSSSELILYLDGIGNVVAANATIGSHGDDPGVGRTDGTGDSYGNTSGHFFNGIIDEMRISDTPRSADWIAAQHLSMNDYFITYTRE